MLIKNTKQAVEIFDKLGILKRNLEIVEESKVVKTLTFRSAINTLTGDIADRGWLTQKTHDVIKLLVVADIKERIGILEKQYAVLDSEKE